MYNHSLTPIYNGNKNNNNYITTRVKDNQFTVYGDNGEVTWVVYGKRYDIEVEPDKNKLMGNGPYKWIHH